MGAWLLVQRLYPWLKASQKRALMPGPLAPRRGQQKSLPSLLSSLLSILPSLPGHVFEELFSLMGNKPGRRLLSHGGERDPVFLPSVFPCSAKISRSCVVPHVGMESPPDSPSDCPPSQQWGKRDLLIIFSASC